MRQTETMGVPGRTDTNKAETDIKSERTTRRDRERKTRG